MQRRQGSAPQPASCPWEHATCSERRQRTLHRTHRTTPGEWVHSYAPARLFVRNLNDTWYESRWVNSNTSTHFGFEVLSAVSTKMAVFWVVASCSLVEVYRRFRGPCCLHHQLEFGRRPEVSSVGRNDTFACLDFGRHQWVVIHEFFSMEILFGLVSAPLGRYSRHTPPVRPVAPPTPPHTPRASILTAIFSHR
jgi:hypothetical protein